MPTDPVMLKEFIYKTNSSLSTGATSHSLTYRAPSRIIGI